MNDETSIKGWGCPKCGRVYAPHIAECAACNGDDAGVPITPNTPPAYTSIQPYTTPWPTYPYYPWPSVVTYDNYTISTTSDDVWVSVSGR